MAACRRLVCEEEVKLAAEWGQLAAGDVSTCSGQAKPRVLANEEIDSLLGFDGARWVFRSVKPERYAVTRAMERVIGTLEDLPADEVLRLLARIRDEDGGESFTEVLFLTLTLSDQTMTAAVVLAFRETVMELLPRYAAQCSISRDAAERFAERLQGHLDNAFPLGGRASLVAAVIGTLPTAADRLAAYRRLLESDADRPPLTEVTAFLIDFADIVAVEGGGIRLTLDGLPVERIGMALKGESEDVREVVLAALDAETSGAVRAWMDGPARCAPAITRLPAPKSSAGRKPWCAMERSLGRCSPPLPRRRRKREFPDRRGGIPALDVRATRSVGRRGAVARPGG